MRHSLGPLALVLLLSAGGLKANPLLAWMPIDLTLLAAVLVLIFVVLARFLDGPASRLISLPIVLWLLLLLSIPSAADTSYASTKTLTLFTVTFVLAVSPFYLLRTSRQRQVFLVGLVAVSGFGLVSLLLEGPASEEFYGRLVLEGSDTIITARIAVAGAIILLILALVAGRRWWHRLLFLACTGVLLSTALMTGSRGPVVSAVVALLATVALTPIFRKYRVRAVVLIALLFAVVVTILARDENVGLQRILEFVSGDSAGSREVRSVLWEDSITSIQHNPFGMGLGSFGLNNEFQIEYPHNILLEIGFELGWLPLLLTVVLITIAIVRSARDGSTPQDAIMFGLLIFSLAGAMVSSDINGSRLFIVTFFAAFALPRTESSTIPDPESPPSGHQFSTQMHLINSNQGSNMRSN